MYLFSNNSYDGTVWNQGKLVGQKAPLKPKDIWAIRVRLQLAKKPRDLALFNLALDSKLRACDLVSLKGGGADGTLESPRSRSLLLTGDRLLRGRFSHQPSAGA